MGIRGKGLIRRINNRTCNGSRIRLHSICGHPSGLQPVTFTSNLLGNEKDKGMSEERFYHHTHTVRL
jgi:hypothetical protein